MTPRSSLPVLLSLSAATACAQTASLTISGAVDLSARYLANTERQRQLATNGTTSSRLVFDGREDLGDGLAAGFRLDGALAPDTGGRSFNFERRSTLSLYSPWGELRVGRDYTPTFWAWADYDPYGALGLGSSLNLAEEHNLRSPRGGAYETQVRASNSIGYLLPERIGGIYGQAMVAAGSGVAGNAYVGGRLGYKLGPVDVAVAASRTRVDPTIGLNAKVFNVGGSYVIGNVKLSGLYNQLGIDAYRRRNALLAANYTWGLYEFKGSYGWVRTRNQLPALPNLDGAGATQLALGAVYNLSKRTATYVIGSRIRNDAGSAFRVASGPVLAPGDSSMGVDFGVRHSF